MVTKSLAASSWIEKITHATAFVPWLVLMALTMLSWWLGDGHGPGQVAAIAVLIVAFFKVAVVGENFMELKHAPLPLRLVFHGWSVVVCAALVGLYLYV